MPARLWLSVSDEPLAHAPLVFLQEHAAELGETIWRIVEDSEDAFRIVDRQRDDHRFAIERVAERGRGRLIDEAGELADVVVPSLRPASIIAARLPRSGYFGFGLTQTSK